MSYISTMMRCVYNEPLTLYQVVVTIINNFVIRMWRCCSRRKSVRTVGDIS